MQSLFKKIYCLNWEIEFVLFISVKYLYFHNLYIFTLNNRDECLQGMFNLFVISCT